MNWKKIISPAFFVLAVGASTLLAGDQYTGWLTDQACAKTGSTTGEIHQKHVASGQPLVFVGEKDNSIHKIANPDKVAMNLVGQKVVLTAKAQNDGSLEVEDAAQAK